MHAAEDIMVLSDWECWLIGTSVDWREQ
jgi:hypothetical protein